MGGRPEISLVDESARWTLGVGEDPIYAPLMADGHFDLGLADQMPAGSDSLTGLLCFVGTGPSCFLERT